VLNIDSLRKFQQVVDPDFDLNEIVSDSFELWYQLLCNVSILCVCACKNADKVGVVHNIIVAINIIMQCLIGFTHHC